MFHTQTTYLPFAFFEGKIIPAELAKVNIMTNALQYGTGIFGGIRGYLANDGKQINIFRIEDHYERFLKSLKIINKSIKYSHRELVEITLELAKKINQNQIVISDLLLMRLPLIFHRIYPM